MASGFEDFVTAGFCVARSADWTMTGWSPPVGADAAIDPETNAPRATAFNTNLCMRFNLAFGSIVPKVVPINYKKTKHLF